MLPVEQIYPGCPHHREMQLCGTALLCNHGTEFCSISGMAGMDFAYTVYFSRTVISLRAIIDVSNDGLEVKQITNSL